MASAGDIEVVPVPKEVDLESEIENDGRLVAKAIVTYYSICKAKGD